MNRFKSASRFFALVLILLSSQKVLSNNAQEVLSQENQEQEDRRTARTQQDVLPDQPGGHYNSNEQLSDVDKKEVRAVLNANGKNQDTSKEVVIQSSDSSSDDSVSKYNFIFYFLYKYKYDQDH